VISDLNGSLGSRYLSLLKLLKLYQEKAQNKIVPDTKKHEHIIKMFMYYIYYYLIIIIIIIMI